MCICYMLWPEGMPIALNESQSAYMKETDDEGWRITLYIQYNASGMGSSHALSTDKTSKESKAHQGVISPSSSSSIRSRIP